MRRIKEIRAATARTLHSCSSPTASIHTSLGNDADPARASAAGAEKSGPRGPLRSAALRPRACLPGPRPGDCLVGQRNPGARVGRAPSGGPAWWLHCRRPRRGGHRWFLPCATSGLHDAHSHRRARSSAGRLAYRVERCVRRRGARRDAWHCADRHALPVSHVGSRLGSRRSGSRSGRAASVFAGRSPLSD